MNDDTDKSLENLINHALDESVDELSPDVQRRLTPMRVIASQAAEKTNSGFSTPWRVASAFSVVVAVSLGWQMWPEVNTELGNDTINVAITSEVSPFDEVLEEDLEMLNDLEFVYWMAEENGQESDGETAIL